MSREGVSSRWWRSRCVGLRMGAVDAQNQGAIVAEE